MEIAILGTGLMGSAMAERFLALDHSLVVYNRTREKTNPLGSLGIKIAESAAHAVESSMCTLLTLTDYDAILEVLFPETQLHPDYSGHTIIQMGTISPNESISLKKTVEGAGGKYLEAPVLGSTPQVKKGDLIVMVGAEPEEFERWSGLLSCFSPKPLYIGVVGKAAALKLALNHLIVSLTAAFSFSLGIILKRGIDIQLFMDILKESPIYALQFDKKLANMRHRDFSDAHFSTKHMLKDVHLMLAEGKSLGLEISVPEVIRKVVQKAVSSGLAEMDYSSLYDTVNPEE